MLLRHFPFDTGQYISLKNSNLQQATFRDHLDADELTFVSPG